MGVWSQWEGGWGALGWPPMPGVGLGVICIETAPKPGRCGGASRKRAGRGPRLPGVPSPSIRHVLVPWPCRGLPATLFWPRRPLPTQPPPLPAAGVPASPPGPASPAWQTLSWRWRWARGWSGGLTGCPAPWAWRGLQAALTWSWEEAGVAGPP